MKVIKFIRENKTIVFALLVVLLSFVLLALPGQFAHYGVLNLKSKVASERFQYNLNGYQWMFGTAKNWNGDKIGSAVPQGIVAFSFLILLVPGLLFSKKSSFVALLTSLLLITTAVLYFTMAPAGLKAYPNYLQAKDHTYYLILWVSYVIASLLLIAGGLMSYRTVLVMKNEVQHPAQAKGPSYNYLHK